MQEARSSYTYSFSVQPFGLAFVLPPPAACGSSAGCGVACPHAQNPSTPTTSIAAANRNTRAHCVDMTQRLRLQRYRNYPGYGHADNLQVVYTVSTVGL